MRKFTGRMNRLFLKTHVFISHADHCVVRDYYKAMFEESEKPEDFDERYKKLVELKEKYVETSEEADWEKYDEFVNDNLPAWYKSQYLVSVTYCEDHPRGMLVNKKTGEQFMEMVSHARTYFKNLSKKNGDTF